MRSVYAASICSDWNHRYYAGMLAYDMCEGTEHRCSGSFVKLKKVLSSAGAYVPTLALLAKGMRRHTGYPSPYLTEGVRRRPGRMSLVRHGPLLLRALRRCRRRGEEEDSHATQEHQQGLHPACLGHVTRLCI